ncbi:GPP34 family phosphoprotein [Actinoplanes sichuanensis]|uniref:GPP34 family phosphoprotein n=1 Tax=Actinoplanes sichuanensis TaxID=512349 RepID=A0ABW4AM67_9ACTN|nr:GPP34 family phosphoprotein [Actinoplanes sichuanensis]BEL11092.1 GPP34 family phosphoprotein [Actinoplanes sichuanensis]
MSTLAEDVLQLVFDDKTGRSVINQTYLDSVIAGALLLDLIRLGRVAPGEPEGRDGRKRAAIVTDRTPTGDPLLDAALATVAEKPLTLKKAVEALVKGNRKAVIERLVERGILRHDRTRVLGIFKLTSFPAADTENEAALRRDLAATLHQGVEPDSRTASLIALLHSVKSLPKVVGGDKTELKNRADTIVAGHPADDAVREAVKQVWTDVEMNAAAVAAAAT